MNRTFLIDVAKDPMGHAIIDYYKNGKAGRLRVFSPSFDEDEIPVEYLFRTFDEMSILEQRAIIESKGRVLDVGGGSGCHSIALKRRGIEVDAIDISPLAVEVMNKSGVKAFQRNFMDESWGGQYDTILLLMNGSGVIGRLEYMGHFFMRLKQLLTPNGVVLMDSSDLKYLFEDMDGSYVLDINNDYYGEMCYSMQYKQIKGDTFDWLYIDFDTLGYYAEQFGFNCECILEGDHYDYLARLSMQK